METNKLVQQDNQNLSIYDSVREVPKEAKKEIEAGRHKGKQDINSMWRIKKLTEVFGPAGFGWYTEIVRTWTEASESGEMAVFVGIHLFVKKDGEWSRLSTETKETGSSPTRRSMRTALHLSERLLKKLHIGFDDPDAFTGREEQILEEFRRVRDEIRIEMSKLQGNEDYK